MPKVKNKERILKAAREKQLISYKGVPTRLSIDFSTEILQARGIGTKYCKWWKVRTYNRDYSTEREGGEEEEEDQQYE